MSEATFQVGIVVEVLPAPEGAYDDWQHVSRRRGVVETVRDGGVLGCRSVRVRFSSDRGGVDCLWWCDPAWLRRVRPTAIRHGEWGCNCACCRYAFRCAVLGHPEKDPGADSPSQRHDRPRSAALYCPHETVTLSDDRRCWICAVKVCNQHFLPASPRHDAPSRPQEA